MCVYAELPKVIPTCEMVGHFEDNERNVRVN